MPLDELSLLVGDSIEADSAAESSGLPLPTADFTASLDYIDSLASRSSLSVNRRDLPGIATAISQFDYLSPLLDSKAVPDQTSRSFSVSTDMRPLQDARMFDPLRSSRRATALLRSASDVVSPSPKAEFPPHFTNPLDPSRDVDDLNRTFGDIERRISRKPFAFKKPDLVVICLKRKIRRNIMHAFGFAGLTGFRRPRRNYWSRVIC